MYFSIIKVPRPPIPFDARDLSLRLAIHQHHSSLPIILLLPTSKLVRQLITHDTPTAREWYRNLHLISWVSRSVASTNHWPCNPKTFHHAVEAICGFPRLEVMKGSYLDWEWGYDDFMPVEKRAKEVLKTPAQILASHYATPHARPTIYTDTYTYPSSPTRTPSTPISALRVLNPERGISLPTLLVLSTRGPTLHLPRRGFYQLGWQLISAFQKYRCQLGCLIVNDRVQRFVVLQDGELAIEFCGAQGAGGMMTAEDLAGIQWGEEDIPSQLPFPFGLTKLEWTGEETGVEAFWGIWEAGVRGGMKWVEGDLERSARGEKEEVMEDGEVIEMEGMGSQRHTAHRHGAGYSASMQRGGWVNSTSTTTTATTDSLGRFPFPSTSGSSGSSRTSHSTNSHFNALGEPTVVSFPSETEYAQMEDFKAGYVAERGFNASGWVVRVLGREEMDGLVGKAYR